MENVSTSVVKKFLLSLQDTLCQKIENVDSSNASFFEDAWSLDDLEGGLCGSGRTRILTGGNVVEQGGISFSHVTGQEIPASATANRPELVGCPFEAMGVSLVVHPRNPYVPTSHANVRFFLSKKKGNKDLTWWFGGGFDLTPFYPFDEDCRSWHQVAKELCRPFGENVYSEHKAWCDRYFYLPHRGETRGVGGLFFDDLNKWGFHTCFSYIKAVGLGSIKAYIPIIERRKKTPFGSQERSFQLYRRGRYVEFNLLHDRGTLFGLKSGGRTESILMSMPPLARWEYRYRPAAESPEAVLKDYLVPRDW